MITRIAGVPEISLVGVFEPGVPNKERIVLRPKIALDIGEYVLTLGVRTATPGLITPIRDAMLWFGSVLITANDWLFVLTGSGTPAALPAVGASGTIYMFYWNRPTTLFHDSLIVPALWKIGGQVVPEAPLALPQPAKSLSSFPS